MKIHLSEAGEPDLFVRAADDVWCPTYRMRDRVLQDVYVTTYYIHHPRGVFARTQDRIEQMSAEGRVLKTLPLIAIVDDEPSASAGDRPAIPSRRLRLLDESGPTRWEKLRRLLNARCGQLQKHRGDEHDAMRHEAARNASSERTESSRELNESEMEDAVSYVEHELWASGFDLDAADAEYRARQEAKAAADATSASALRRVA